jgi:hypothetical protein
MYPLTVFVAPLSDAFPVRALRVSLDCVWDGRKGVGDSERTRCPPLAGPTRWRDQYHYG